MASSSSNSVVRLFLIGLCVLTVAECRILSAVRKGLWQHQIVEGFHSEAVITAEFNNTIEENG